MRANRFSFLAWAAVAAAAALLALAACEDDDVNLANPPANTKGYTHYFPLAVGNKWQYRCTHEADEHEPQTWNMAIEVVEVKDNYKFAAKAYVIRIQEDGQSDREVIAACAGNSIYLQFPPYAGPFLLLFKDDMEQSEAVESETGFFTEDRHHRREDTDVDVPAGTFPDCLFMVWEINYNNTHVSWDDEFYAKDAGLVRYLTGNYQLVNHELTYYDRWSYELTSYAVAPLPE